MIVSKVWIISCGLDALIENMMHAIKKELIRRRDHKREGDILTQKNGFMTRGFFSAYKRPPILRLRFFDFTLRVELNLDYKRRRGYRGRYFYIRLMCKIYSVCEKLESRELVDRIYVYCTYSTYIYSEYTSISFLHTMHPSINLF